MVTVNACSSDKSNTISAIYNGIEESSIEKAIKIYPNPFKNELNIEIENSNSEIKFEIINDIGQCLLSRNFTKKSSIDLSKLSTGIYIGKIYLNEKVYFKNIVKE
jgi:hypothetical protein